jgi:hypothetical protein
MKTALISIALILAGAFSGIILLGGVYHCRYTRYFPSSAATGLSESDFSPYLTPLFTRSASPLHETIIPYLFYRDSMPDLDPHIALITTDRTERHGYVGKSSLVIESFMVQNESGELFMLIGPGTTRTFSLADSGYGWNEEDLGAVQGDVLRLIVHGYVVTNDGAKKRFSHNQQWTKTFSTRTTFGIVLAE